MRNKINRADTLIFIPLHDYSELNPILTKGVPILHQNSQTSQEGPHCCLLCTGFFSGDITSESLVSHTNKHNFKYLFGFLNPSHDLPLPLSRSRLAWSANWGLLPQNLRRTDDGWTNGRSLRNTTEEPSRGREKKMNRKTC